jgi:hypothetical protein
VEAQERTSSNNERHHAHDWFEPSSDIVDPSDPSNSEGLVPCVDEPWIPQRSGGDEVKGLIENSSFHLTLFGGC